MVLRAYAPQLFTGGDAISSTSALTGSDGQVTFPLDPDRAGGPRPSSNAQFVATAQFAPTLVPSPTPYGATPNPDNVTIPATCPTPGPAPALTGATVRDGASPAPLFAGCPVSLYISAPGQPNTQVIISLTFGTANSRSCSVYSNSGRTDDRGNAVIHFTVPGNVCFHGTIITSGSIFVGANSSANANFIAAG